jgi:3-deoxy-D-manno-octulosonate 8-phosphate phosphatase (KDO 8-P phosphatase)
MKIRLFIMDVDGTLTDGKIYMGNNGELFKAFDIKDGCGIHDILPKYNIEPIIITARKSSILSCRCSELGISMLYQGVSNKIKKMIEIMEHYGIVSDANGVYQEVAYIGDDIIDIPSMKICGIKGCPSDAVIGVKEISDYVTSKSGGNGAVREFIDWIVNVHC